MDKNTKQQLQEMLNEEGLWADDDDGYRYAFLAENLLPPQIHHFWRKIPDQKIDSYFSSVRSQAKREQKKRMLKIPIALGYTPKKILIRDLAEMPHMLVAGATKQGKTNFLYNLLVSSFLLNHPKILKIVVLDTTGFSFEKIRKYRLTASFDKVDDITCALKTIKQESRRRSQIFRKCGVESIYSHNARQVRLDALDKLMPFVLVLFDEFQTFPLSKNQKHRAVYDEVVELAAITRKLGIHFVFATQTPYAKVITGLLKANLIGRVAFRCRTKQASLSVLDTSHAFTKLKAPGEFIFDEGCDVEFAKTFYFSEGEKKQICENTNRLGFDYSLK